MIYAVDFDGTLCKNKYPKIGDPIQITIDFCKNCMTNKDRLILWTCRNGELLDEAVVWCTDQGIEFEAVNENLDDVIKKYGSDTRKICADFYIDDRNLSLDDLEKRGEKMPLKLQEREYRSLVSLLNPSQTQKRIDSDFYVEGFATTFDKPYLLWDDGLWKYYEIVDKNAFSGTDMTDVIMQYDHAGKVLARQSNKTLVLEVNASGLFIAADLAKSAAAKDMYEEISNGLVTRMSWAFTVDKSQWTEDQATQTATRRILHVKKVYDVSAVSIPANPDTSIDARSLEQGSLDRELKEYQQRKNTIRRLSLLAQI